MKLLLDTQIFLWYITADPRLPATFHAAIQDPANDVFLSVASVWEAVIKHALGKLPLPAPPHEQANQYDLTLLTVDGLVKGYPVKLLTS